MNFLSLKKFNFGEEAKDFSLRKEKKNVIKDE
jgi:hypothetical protein